MKPVLILQHLNADGPAYLAQWLRREGRAFEVRNTEAGDAFPSSIDAYSALAVLGGEWSANDERASLRAAERLVLDAMESGVPVIGHCLGGQLMARALGARVAASDAPEVGWHRIRVQDPSQAAPWFGDGESAMVFQWHYDAFELPRGATPLATSDACAHQDSPTASTRSGFRRGAKPSVPTPPSVLSKGQSRRPIAHFTIRNPLSAL